MLPAATAVLTRARFRAIVPVIACITIPVVAVVAVSLAPVVSSIPITLAPVVAIAVM